MPARGGGGLPCCRAFGSAPAGCPAGVSQVEEGMEVLDALGAEYVDGEGRPYRDVRLLHTAVLDDPFEDPVT